MQPNELLSVLLKALGILLLIVSLGILADGVVSVISALASDYGKPGMAILSFLTKFIYLIGAVGMIIGSKFVAKNIDKIEVNK